MTRSDAEELFLRLVRRARLEHPEVNAAAARSSATASATASLRTWAIR
jgi:hypothetical protein